jgi:Tir chaperone protein (CesT) family
MANFVELIRALGSEAGLKVEWEPVSPVEFAVDGLPVVVSLDRRSGADAIVLYSELGEVPAERELEVYRVLLEANVMWSGTGDATLAVNSATKRALLCYRIALKDLDGPGFNAVVSAFVELARGWRDFIAAAVEEISAAQAPRRAGMIAG